MLLLSRIASSVVSLAVLAALVQPHAANADAMSRPTVSGVLEQIATRLPADTRVDRIAIAGGTLQVQGLATDIDEVLAALEASPLIEGVKRTIADAPDAATAKQQFLVEAKLVAPKAAAAKRRAATEPTRERVDRVLDAQPADGCQRLSSMTLQQPDGDAPVRVRLRCRVAALPPVLAALESGDVPLSLDRFQSWRQAGVMRVGDTMHSEFLDVQFEARSPAAKD